MCRQNSISFLRAEVLRAEVLRAEVLRAEVLRAEVLRAEVTVTGPRTPSLPLRRRRRKFAPAGPLFLRIFPRPPQVGRSRRVDWQRQLSHGKLLAAGREPRGASR
jgi:hypothetical protein